MLEQSDLVNAPFSDAQTFKIRPSDPRLAEFLKDYPPPVFSERLYQSIELMERYSVEMAIDLARRLNVIDQLDQWRSVDDMCRLLSFQPSFRFALHWILERLVEIDCVEARVTRPYLERLRVREWRVHKVTLLRHRLQVGLQLLRGLRRDSKN